MQEYKVNEVESRKILWRIRVLLPLATICGCAASLLIYYLFQSKEQTGNYTVPAATILITIMIFIAWWQSLKANTDYFGSYKLIVTEDAVTEEAMHRPGVTIEKSKIAVISASKDGSLTIVSRSGRKLIRIPKIIENRAELYTTLSAIKNISVADASPVNTVLRNGVIIASLACGAIAAFTENETVLAVCGIAMGCILAGGSIFTIASRPADAKLKMIAKIVLAIMVVGLIATCMLKFL